MNERDMRGNFAAAWLFRATCALALAWSAASLTWPFGWDQGIFAWVGDVINHGGAPYRDGWDVKGPLTFYLYALAEFLFGRNLWGVRLLDLLFTAAGAAALYKLVASLAAQPVAKWTAVLFILWLASGSFWHTAQPDGWASILILVALTPLLAGEQRRFGAAVLLMTGVLIGCCVLFKPFYLMFLALPLLAMVTRDRPRWRHIVHSSLIILGGFLIPLLICLSWFAYRQALRELIQVWLSYPVKVYSGISTASPGARIRGVVEYVTGGRVVAVLWPMVGFGALSLWRSRKGTAVTVIAWLIMAVFCVALQNKFYLYHWAVVYPPIAVLCAAAFDRLFFESPRTEAADFPAARLASQRTLGICVLGIVLFNAAVHPLYDVMSWASYVGGRVSREAYYNNFGIPGPDIQAAEYIRSRTTEDDRVFVWGWNVSITYMSGRQSNSRFGYSMPLMLGPGTEECELYRQEFLRSIKAHPPTYIVVAPQSELILQGHYDLNDFGELSDFVSQNYTNEKVFGDLILYRLKSPRA